MNIFVRQNINEFLIMSGKKIASDPGDKAAQEVLLKILNLVVPMGMKSVDFSKKEKQYEMLYQQVRRLCKVLANKYNVPYIVQHYFIGDRAHISSLTVATGLTSNTKILPTTSSSSNSKSRNKRIQGVKYILYTTKQAQQNIINGGGMLDNRNRAIKAATTEYDREKRRRREKGARSLRIREYQIWHKPSITSHPDSFEEWKC